MEKINIFWFRRDLRLHDNAGLYHALKSGSPVVPIFIFDTNILDKLEDKKDKRVEFIRDTLAGIQKELKEIKSGLRVSYGTPQESFEQLLSEYNIETEKMKLDKESFNVFGVDSSGKNELIKCK